MNDCKFSLIVARDLIYWKYSACNKSASINESIQSIKLFSLTVALSVFLSLCLSVCLSVWLPAWLLVVRFLTVICDNKKILVCFGFFKTLIFRGGL